MEGFSFVEPNHGRLCRFTSVLGDRQLIHWYVFPPIVNLQARPKKKTIVFILYLLPPDIIFGITGPSGSPIKILNFSLGIRMAY